MLRFVALVLVLALAAPALADSNYGGSGGSGNANGGSNSGNGGNNTGNSTAGNSTGDMAMEHSSGRGPREGNATRDDDEQDRHDSSAWEAMPKLRRSLGLQHAERSRLFAELLLNNGQATGRFVSFGYNATLGDLTDYRAVDLNTTFFSLVHAEGFVANGTPEGHGATFRMRGDGASLTVHNNPTAQLAVRGANLTLHVDLAANVTAGNVTGNRTVKLTAANGQHGHLVLLGNGTVRPTATGLQFDVADGGVMFLAHPANTATGDALHDLVAATAGGKLGAIASVVDADGSAIEETDSWGVHVRAEHSGNRSLTVNISSDDPAGKVVVLRTDNATVPANESRDVVVTLNGVAMARAADANDAITNGTGPGQGKAFVTVTAGGIQVVVGVPHFSAYLLAIGSTLPAEQPSPAPSPAPPAPSGAPNGTSSTPKGTPGFEPLLLLGAVAALGLLRRRAA